MRRLLSDSYSEPPPIPLPPTAAFPAWETSFNDYMNGADYLSEGQSIVTWWGVGSSADPCYIITPDCCLAEL